MFRTKSAVSVLAKHLTKGVAALKSASAAGERRSSSSAKKNGNNNNNDNKKEAKQQKKTSTNISDSIGVEYNASKAGLQQVDKLYVESVIAEASRGSRFSKHKLQQQKERDARNEVVLQKAAYFQNKMPKEERRAITAETDRILAELEARRVFGTPVVEEGKHGKGASVKPVMKKHVFMHFDMDMFYAAVEEKRDPTLKDVPFAVGSKSMLSTSNYVAREYGIRSGMPGFIARRLCPELVIVPVNMELYKEEAELIRRTIATYDPLFITVGLDEMTINVTDYLWEENKKRRLKSPRAKLLTPEALCTQIRDHVFRATRLTCSGGIGPTPALSKLASNINKPNGQYYHDFTTRDEVLQYMATLPVRQVSGIGFAQEKKLKALGIEHGSDMLTHKDLLYYLFGGDSKTFRFYLSIGLGLMKTHVDRALEARQLRTQQEALCAQLEQEKSALQTGKVSSAVKVMKPVPFAIGGGEPRKSVGKEITLGERMKADKFHGKLKNVLLHVVTGAQETLLREHLMTQQVELVVKNIFFEQRSFLYTFPEKTNDVKRILDGCNQIIIRETLAALKAARAQQKVEKLAKSKKTKSKKKGAAAPSSDASKPSYHNIFDFDRIRLVGVRLTRLTSVQDEADAVKRATAFMKQGKQTYVFANSKDTSKKPSTSSTQKRKKQKKSEPKKQSKALVVKKAAKEVKRQLKKKKTIAVNI